MRIFRRIQVLMGLIIVLAVGVVLIRLGDMARQDGAILEWSNTLVSKKVGATYAPRFFSQAVRDGPNPNVWVVSGDIALPRSGDGETRDQYVAIVRQVCKSRTEKKCWVLQSLTLGNEELAASAANGSRAGTVPAKGPATATATGWGPIFSTHSRLRRSAQESSHRLRLSRSVAT